MEILFNTISFLAIISLIVFVHELGHYLIAIAQNVKVEVFSIGLGPKLCSWSDKRGTNWRIALFPIGGYVKMFGDSNPASHPDQDLLSTLSENEKSRSFHHKKLWQKSLIIAAGPVFNFLFAMLMFICLFCFYGKQYISAEITAVQANSPAQLAGLQVGDIITHIDDVAIDNFTKVQRIVSMNGNKVLYFIVNRDGATFELKITPAYQASENSHAKKSITPTIGIMADKILWQKYKLNAAIIEAFNQTIRLIALTFESIWQIITGKLSVESLGGPIKIAQYSAHSLKDGVQGAIWFIAILSINLGAMNLLPIPLLDGGHLVFYLLEAIRGNALPAKWQNFAFGIGMAILSSLMLFTVLNDIRGLF
jgi:regulator of sigma E protease